MIETRPKGWNVICMDESIMLYESTIRKVWFMKGTRPIRRVTGSHSKTCLFGALSLDKKQLFRQKKEINSETTIEFLKELKRKFGRFVLFLDKASYHKSYMVKEFFKKNKDCIKPIYFPTAASDLNPAEEPWKQIRGEFIKLPKNVTEFRKKVSGVIRKKRYKLDIVKYLCQ